MSHYYERNDSGYTRGGLDVVTGINLFFKGILIFPILVLSTYLGLALVKHMLFQGVPTMAQPPAQAAERIEVVPFTPAPTPEPSPYPEVIPQPISDEVPDVGECDPYGPMDFSYNPPRLVCETGKTDLDNTWTTEILEDPFS